MFFPIYILFRLDDTIFVHSFLKAGCPRQQEEWQANLDENFQRAELETQNKIIEDIWLKRSKENPRLYNGKLYRLHSFTENTFNLGITCYKDFLGTNCAPNNKELRSLGQSQENSQKFMADPLGVGALIITNDDHVVFTRRAAWTGEYAGFLDIPGGHPEPKYVVGSDSSSLIAEIFGSIAREATDEVNLPANSISSPLLMGLVRNEETGGRPNLQFLIQ